jgi:hypothetical protein
MDLAPTIKLLVGGSASGSESDAKPCIISSLHHHASDRKTTNDKAFTREIQRNLSPGPKDTFKVPTGYGSDFSDRVKVVLKEGCATLIIQHYAGPVCYIINDWVTKDKDDADPFLLQALGTTSNSYLQKVYPAVSRLLPNGLVLMTGAMRYLKELGSLLQVLRSSDLHRIRCITPNTHRVPGLLDQRLILAQLRSNGVLEAVRIDQLGYSHREIYGDFVKQYQTLLPVAVTPGIPLDNAANRSVVQDLLISAGGKEGSTYKMGLTKVFLKRHLVTSLGVKVLVAHQLKAERMEIEKAKEVAAAARHADEAEVISKFQRGRAEINRLLAAYAEVSETERRTLEELSTAKALLTEMMTLEGWHYVEGS